MRKICVLGSINIDTTYYVSALPQVGGKRGSHRTFQLPWWQRL